MKQRERVKRADIKGEGESRVKYVVRDKRGPKNQDNKLKSAACRGGRLGYL